MAWFKRLALFLRVTRSQSILRRYFVVNGFDGALTMLGLIAGFIMSATSDLTVIVNACLGASIALCISGMSSAYISEQAERRRSLIQLETAMLIDLEKTTHGEAVRWVPLIVALVNGSSPLIMSLIIISPLWLASCGFLFWITPLYLAGGVALVIIFLLGIFLGQVAASSMLLSGLKTASIALLTLIIIYMLVGFSY